MKKVLLILFCLFIASCSSPAEQNLNNSTQEIIEEPSKTQTPEPSNTPTLSITPTITSTPTPQPFSIGDGSGTLSFMEGSQLNFSDINGQYPILINPGIVRLSKYSALPYHWSPDERYITFRSGIGDLSFLRLVDVNSSEVKDISLPSLSSKSFSWHPSGRKIAVSPAAEIGRAHV